MHTLEALQRRIGTAEDLQDIVKTMKVLAAVGIRQYERAVASLADYNRTVDLGLQVVLRQGAGSLPASRPAPDGGLGALIFGSDQGLCGRFNDHLVLSGLTILHDLEPASPRRTVVAIGARVTARLEEMGQPVLATFAAPASLAGITPMVQNLLLYLETWRRQQRLVRLVLLHHTLLEGNTFQPQVVHLMPIDLSRYQNLAKQPWPSRALPTFSMDRRELLSSLVRQRLFVSLYRALAESLACENASRLASMQVAERNIAERLEDLRAQFRYQRQHAITAELLDIVAGFEALHRQEEGET